MKLWICLALVSLNFACVAKVRIDVFYESLCPDSVRFVTNQLAPLYDAFKKHLEINFIPFGKSYSYKESPESPIEFTCQHGPEECFGNKVQGCMLSRLPDQDAQMSYVACQMARLQPDHQPCVEAFGISFDEILQCVESEFATRQQLDYEQITHPATNFTNWVPTIAYNGKITLDLSHTGNAPPLKEILCNLIHNTNPACALKRRF